jgi:hypothetical protein
MTTWGDRTAEQAVTAVLSAWTSWRGTQKAPYDKAMITVGDLLLEHGLVELEADTEIPRLSAVGKALLADVVEPHTIAAALGLPVGADREEILAAASALRRERAVLQGDMERALHSVRSLLGVAANDDITDEIRRIIAQRDDAWQQLRAATATEIDNERLRRERAGLCAAERERDELLEFLGAEDMGAARREVQRLQHVRPRKGASVTYEEIRAEIENLRALTTRLAAEQLPGWRVEHCARSLAVLRSPCGERYMARIEGTTVIRLLNDVEVTDVLR